MEQHPVPRNITGFQFHLIGDMTLRQFFYLAGGIALGFFIFKSAPLPSLIKYAATGIAGFAGFAFAFLPIQERPLDKWLIAFIRSVFSPTQYLWQKNNQPLHILLVPASHHAQNISPQHKDLHLEAQAKLDAYLKSLPQHHAQTLNIAEKNYIDKTLALFNSNSAVNMQPAIKPIAQTPPKPNAQTIKPASEVNKKDTIMPKTVVVKPEEKPPTDLNDVQKQLFHLNQEKTLLLKELESLKSKINDPNMKPEIISPQTAVSTKQPTIKSIPADIAKEEIGLINIPQTPNVVIGVIKDGSKKLLPNIIITIKDKSGLPLRALKTNKLGQFASATPLPNGTYYIETEDPLNRYIFDIAQINLIGKVFLPVEIIAKGEKEIMREKLQKELFGSVASI
jgi:hypothetical protein